jgi:hypothetical protein
MVKKYKSHFLKTKQIIFNKKGQIVVSKQYLLVNTNKYFAYQVKKGS